MLSEAKRLQLIPSNPIADVRPVSYAAPTRTILTLERPRYQKPVLLGSVNSRAGCGNERLNRHSVQVSIYLFLNRRSDVRVISGAKTIPYFRKNCRARARTRKRRGGIHRSCSRQRVILFSLGAIYRPIAPVPRVLSCSESSLCSSAFSFCSGRAPSPSQMTKSSRRVEGEYETMFECLGM
jgi:hypothetical protein